MWGRLKAALQCGVQMPLIAGCLQEAFGLRNSWISVCLCQGFWELVGPELWPAKGVHDEVTKFGMKGAVGKR